MIQKTIIPKNTKVNLSFVVPENYVGEEIEVVAYIKNKEFTSLPSDALPSIKGNPLTNIEFKNWIEQAEKMQTISLEAINSKWTNRKKQLQMLIK